jgi:MarR family transcriptional regulator, temperature-dependent positive regulator of motility
MKPSTESFLDEYLYGPLAKPTRGGSPADVERPTIPGRRAPAYLAKRFGQIMQGLMAEALEPHGLVPQQWGIIVAIVREPGTDQRRVAQRQSIDANSAKRLVDELETLGLVRRMASPTDRRAHRLELTSSGNQMWQKLRMSLRAVQDNVLEPLDRLEKEKLMELLTRVVEANKAYARPGNGRRRPVRATVKTQERQGA